MALTATETEEIRKALLARREEVLGDFLAKNAEAAALLDEGVADIGDQGLVDHLGEILHLLGESRREEILGFDEALDRLRKGTYDQCRQCGEPIGIKRLRARPQSLYCIACKEKIEEEESRRAGPGRGTL